MEALGLDMDVKEFCAIAGNALLAMDLGKFEDASDDIAGAVKQQSMEKWRLDPTESFSDWTIEIRLEAAVDSGTPQQDNIPGQDDPSETFATYHVHKERLGTGPRSSLYFAKVFRSHFSETSAQKSIITLPKTVAKSFPIMLDFVYSESSNVIIDSPAAAVAIRYMANYFGVKELFDNVNATFISSNMSHDTVFDYIHESIRYNDNSLRKAAASYVSNAISSNTQLPHWEQKLADLPLATFLEIVELASPACPWFGSVIIEYIDANRERVSSEHVATLLQNLTPESFQQNPFQFLEVVEQYKLSATHPARVACTSATGETWHNRPYLWVSSSDGISPKAQEEATFASLSDAQKITILQASLKSAYHDRETTVPQIVATAPQTVVTAPRPYSSYQDRRRRAGYDRPCPLDD
jgi:BTB/POZ domain